MTQPTLGRVVHYRLSEQDVQQITQRRARTGDTGQENRAGDICPAIVTNVWMTGEANLKVLLDAQDDHWPPSRTEGDTPGTWSWLSRPDYIIRTEQPLSADDAQALREHVTAHVLSGLRFGAAIHVPTG